MLGNTLLLGKAVTTRLINMHPLGQVTGRGHQMNSELAPDEFNLSLAQPHGMSPKSPVQASHSLPEPGL